MLPTFRKSLIVAISTSALILTGGIATAQASAADSATYPVRISKVAEDNTSSELKDAHLSLSIPGGDPQTWTSSTSPHEVKLAPGTYTLTETSAPKDYDVAEPISFTVTDKGTIEAPSTVLSFSPVDATPVRAYNDFNDETPHWGQNPYGKNYYVDRDTKNESAAGDEVIYCFNMDLNHPPDSYNYGENIDPDVTGKEVNFTARYVFDGLAQYANTPKVQDPATLALKIRKVIEAGYPNNKKTFGTGLTSTEFRAATQLAVYYWSDSFTLEKIREIVAKDGVDSQKTHGFGRIDTPEGAKVKAAYEKIIAYAEDSNSDSDIVDKNIGVYIPNLSNYQRFISSKDTPQERIPVIAMVDKKTVAPDTPQPKADVKESPAKNPQSDCKKKQVTETFTVTTTPYKWDTASKTWVLDTDKATTEDVNRTREMTDAELQTCTPQPKADVKESPAKNPQSDCKKKQVTETFTVTTTPYKWDTASKTWVLDTDKATTEDVNRTREMTDAELQTCTPQPKAQAKERSLALTGLSSSNLLGIGAAMFAVGVIGLSTRKRSKE